MKPIAHQEGDPPLDELLREWKVNESLPPRFQERVWHRIALSEAARPARNAWMTLFGRIQSMLAQPRLAAGYVTALLVVGFAAGWAQGLEKSARLDQALGARYVQVIDPYQSVPH